MDVSGMMDAAIHSEADRWNRVLSLLAVLDERTQGIEEHLKQLNGSVGKHDAELQAVNMRCAERGATAQSRQAIDKMLIGSVIILVLLHAAEMIARVKF